MPEDIAGQPHEEHPWLKDCEKYTPTHLEMELAVDAFAIGIDHFECVRPVAIHVSVTIGQTAIAEQEGHLHRGCDTDETLSDLF